jgi:hypothetical protein
VVSNRPGYGYYELAAVRPHLNQGYACVQQVLNLFTVVPSISNKCRMSATAQLYPFLPSVLTKTLI